MDWLNAARKRTGATGSATANGWNASCPSGPSMRSTDRPTRPRLLEDPQREGPGTAAAWSSDMSSPARPATTRGLICKAADAGYKIIIVLAGLHNNLRPDPDAARRGLPRVRDERHRPGEPAGPSASASRRATRHTAELRHQPRREGRLHTRDRRAISASRPAAALAVRRQEEQDGSEAACSSWIRNHVANAQDRDDGPEDRHEPAAAGDRRRGRPRVRGHGGAGCSTRTASPTRSTSQRRSTGSSAHPARSRSGLCRLHGDAVREHLHPRAGRDQATKARTSSRGLHHQSRGAVQLRRPGARSSARRTEEGAVAGCRSCAHPVTRRASGWMPHESQERPRRRFTTARTTAAVAARGDRLPSSSLRRSGGARTGSGAQLDARPRHPLHRRAGAVHATRSRSGSAI